jgi:hypothetical protein
MTHKRGWHWQRRRRHYNPAIDQTGRRAVNLALKFDVLAVCAVFMFVGAVLLGAF